MAGVRCNAKEMDMHRSNMCKSISTDCQLNPLLCCEDRSSVT